MDSSHNCNLISGTKYSEFNMDCSQKCNFHCWWCIIWTCDHKYHFQYWWCIICLTWHVIKTGMHVWMWVEYLLNIVYFDFPEFPFKIIFQILFSIVFNLCETGQYIYWNCYDDFVENTVFICGQFWVKWVNSIFACPLPFPLVSKQQQGISQGSKVSREIPHGGLLPRF